MQKSREEKLAEWLTNKVLKQKNSNTVTKKDIKPDSKVTKSEIKKPAKQALENKVRPALEKTKEKEPTVKHKKQVDAPEKESVENHVKESVPDEQDITDTLDLLHKEDPTETIEIKNDSFSDNKEHDLVNHNIVVQLELESKNNQIEQLSLLNKRLKAQLEENESQKDHIINEMEQIVKKLTAEIDELEKKPEEHADKWILLTKVEQLQEIINEKDLEISRLSTTAAHGETPVISELQNQIKEQEAEINDIKANQSYLQSKINEYQQILNQKDSVIQMQKSQLNEIQANLNQSQNELFLLKNTSKKEYDQDYSNLKNENHQLHSENKVIKTDLESSIECIELLEKEINELQMKLSETETANEINTNMYKQNINELEQALSETLVENKQLFDTNSEMEKEKQELVSVMEELETIQSKYENSDDRIMELEQENLSIMAMNSKYQIEMAEFQLALKDSLDENKELYMKLDSNPNKQDSECQTEACDKVDFKETITKLSLAGNIQTQKYETKIINLKKEKLVIQNILEKEKELQNRLIKALENADEQNKELKDKLK
ncbi:hypothetical protein HDV01_006777 [Terramyces sp. JEL0728]|nr:hypothetical protein HDV01_006777 [Terramyces sp. JEL0728]